jgi:hypothetical protein
MHKQRIAGCCQRCKKKNVCYWSPHRQKGPTNGLVKRMESGDCELKLSRCPQKILLPYMADFCNPRFYSRCCDGNQNRNVYFEYDNRQLRNLRDSPGADWQERRWRKDFSFPRMMPILLLLVHLNYKWFSLLSGYLSLHWKLRCRTWRDTT